MKKTLEFWLERKVAKGAVKLIGPLAVAGAGYYLYKKYKGGDSIASS